MSYAKEVVGGGLFNTTNKALAPSFCVVSDPSFLLTHTHGGSK